MIAPGGRVAADGRIGDRQRAKVGDAPAVAGRVAADRGVDHVSVGGPIPLAMPPPHGAVLPLIVEPMTVSVPKLAMPPPPRPIGDVLPLIVEFSRVSAPELSEAASHALGRVADDRGVGDGEGAQVGDAPAATCHEATVGCRVAADRGVGDREGAVVGEAPVGGPPEMVRPEMVAVTPRPPGRPDGRIAADRQPHPPRGRRSPPARPSRTVPAGSPHAIVCGEENNAGRTR